MALRIWLEILIQLATVADNLTRTANIVGEIGLPRLCGRLLKLSKEASMLAGEYRELFDCIEGDTTTTKDGITVAEDNGKWIVYNEDCEWAEFDDQVEARVKADEWRKKGGKIT